MLSRVPAPLVAAFALLAATSAVVAAPSTGVVDLAVAGTVSTTDTPR